MVTDICRDCVHDEVCKHKATCQAAQKAISEVIVYQDYECMLQLKDISWINAEIGCEYFEHV